jgi:endoglucanase
MLKSLSLLAACFLIGCVSSPDAFQQQASLGRGINLGNSLEAPVEGAWGPKITDEDLVRLKKAGFNSVRIPTRWSAHALKVAPYTIDPAFMARVDHVVQVALSQGLVVVLNAHHYQEIDEAPAEHRECLAMMWRQIATHFADFPESLQFEIYNEPNTQHTAEAWNLTLAAALQEIRKTNPTRAVHIGGVEWNKIGTLKDLKLPPEDRHIIAQIHYYAPFHFTHQNASWVKGSTAWNGTKWDGTEADKEAVRRDFKAAADWSQKEQRPVFMGEFGTSAGVADMDARVRWTAFIASEAPRYHLTWAYWEYQANFGIWDPKAQQWREPLKAALLGNK